MTTLGVKTGAIVGSGVVAEAAIFSDISYLYLALVGALVSVFGVAHEVFGANNEKYSVGETAVELLKGLALGVLAIPFWFITLTSLGDDILIKYLHITPDPSTFTSLSLIIAFALSWFTVPMFDFAAKTIPKIVKNFVAKMLRRD